MDGDTAIVDEVSNAYQLWLMTSESSCPNHLSELDRFRNTKKTKDAWGSELKLECDGKSDSGLFVVISAGPDSRFGTFDDIRSDRFDSTLIDKSDGQSSAQEAE